jgi:general secretion pathway protein G
VEVMIAATIVVALTAITLPKFASYRLQAQIAQAVSDVRSLDLAIQIYRRQNHTLPVSLLDLGISIKPDPWGRPYEYLKIEGDLLALTKAKKDLFHVPINSDLDLFSRGADGATSSVVILPASQDDILRANGGGYVGLASEY